MNKMKKIGVILTSVVFSLVLLSSITMPSYSDYLSPKKQIESGVALADITCKSDHVAVFRTSGDPACVKNATAEYLGWPKIEALSRLVDDISNPPSPVVSAVDVELDPIWYSDGPISTKYLDSISDVSGSDVPVSGEPRAVPYETELIVSKIPRVGDVIDITFIVSNPDLLVGYGGWYANLYVYDEYELLDVPEEFNVEYTETECIYSCSPGLYTLTTKETINLDDGVPRQFNLQVEVIREGYAAIVGGVHDVQSRFDVVIGKTETLPINDYYAKYPDEEPVPIYVPTEYDELRIWEEERGLSPSGYSTFEIDTITEEEFRLFLELNDFDHIDDIDAAVAEAYPDEDHHVMEPAVEPMSPIFTVSAQDIESAVIPDSIATKNNAFTIDFYRQVSSNTDDDSNIFFSPTSMYVAFSILYEGAKQNTAEEIQQIFDFEPDETMRHNDTAHAISSINRDDPHATLVMANALWLADWFEPYDSYLDVGRQTYLAGIKTVSFIEPEKEPDGVKQINDWASDNTNGKIPKVIGKGDVNDLTAMAITNAIYFKGTWQTQFDPENTKESDFWTSESKNTTANFMATKDTFPYTKSHGTQVLKMPYEGDRLSMLVILPEDRHGIDVLEESLTPEMIEGWQQDVRSTDVIVEMPKFKMSTHL